MVKKLKRDEQECMQDVCSNFINFYYNSLNSKQYSEIFKYIRNFTVISVENTVHKGECISNHFKYLQSVDASFSDITFDALHSGTRRYNILVTGNIKFLVNDQYVQVKFSEYIQCGNDTKTEFWIQMSIFKLLNY